MAQITIEGLLMHYFVRKGDDEAMAEFRTKKVLKGFDEITESNCEIFERSEKNMNDTFVYMTSGCFCPKHKKQ